MQFLTIVLLSLVAVSFVLSQDSSEGDDFDKRQVDEGSSSEEDESDDDQGSSSSEGDDENDDEKRSVAQDSSSEEYDFKKRGKGKLKVAKASHFQLAAQYRYRRR